MNQTNGLAFCIKKKQKKRKYIFMHYDMCEMLSILELFTWQ